ncbi:MAG: hypothetical protein B7C24_03730 [Bacteroidetes bacterium 4572_77]|nr:MAG: hypothetical protein B7C24_03730 [Bacteroidetes bacterium 4572_77]
MKITKNSFGKLKDGQEVGLFILENDKNVSVSILSYGARIQSIKTPNEEGELKDIVLGYDNIRDYETDPYYMGALIGPVAGRIANAQYVEESKTIKLEQNHQTHHLHGGSHGLHQKLWNYSSEERSGSVKLVMQTFAKDGEGGYAGNREFKTTYILNNKNQLLIYMNVQTDKDSMINLTSHSYYNLSDKENCNILDQIMMINAPKVMSMNADLLPTGGFEYVLGKPANFTRGKKLGEALQVLPNGLDHVYAINKEYGKFGISAKALDADSGRTIDLVTNQPAVVLYTNNSADGSVLGKNSLPIIKHGAFCLEPMHFPDSPNQLNFPSILLKAGETYKSRSQFTFGLVSQSHHH